MSKERLEEAKEVYGEWLEGAEDEQNLKVDEFVYRFAGFLIGQAERFEVLAEQHDEALMKNKRYRESLNNIILMWLSSTDATDDTWLAHEMSETARKALEQSE